MEAHGDYKFQYIPRQHPASRTYSTLHTDTSRNLTVYIMYYTTGPNFESNEGVMV